MMQFLSSLMCRLFGRSCSVTRPSSKDLIREMRTKSDDVAKVTIRLRKEREDLSRSFEYTP